MKKLGFKFYVTLVFLPLLLQIQLVSEHAFEIPDNVRPGHLIKELSKVIRALEVRSYH